MIITPKHYITESIYSPIEMWKDTMDFLHISKEELFNIITIQDEPISTEFTDYFKDKEINDENLVKFYSNYTGHILGAWTDTYNKMRDIGVVASIGNLNKEAKILEFGGGNGSLCLLLKSYGFNITYCDLEMPSKFAKYRFDKYKLDVPICHKVEGKYDIIVSLEVFEHLFNLKEVLLNLVDHLNRDGYLIFAESCEDIGRAEHLDKNFEYGRQNLIKLLTGFGLTHISSNMWQILAEEDLSGKLNIKKIGNGQFMVMKK